MAKIRRMSVRPARGMRDFLPQEVRRRDYVIAIIESIYRGYGFQPLETPALENIETLTGKYGEEGNKLIFKVLRRGEHESSGETDLALRYDLTVPLARVVAEHRGKLPRFFKRYQIQPVWRADRPARGRFREFYQCDVDAIGSKSMVVETELCSAVADVLQRLGFADFVIRIIIGLWTTLDALAWPADCTACAGGARQEDKIGAHGVRRELHERGITPMRRCFGLRRRCHASSLAPSWRTAQAQAAILELDLSSRSRPPTRARICGST